MVVLEFYLEKMLHIRFIGFRNVCGLGHLNNIDVQAPICKPYLFSLAVFFILLFYEIAIHYKIKFSKQTPEDIDSEFICVGLNYYFACYIQCSLPIGVIYK